LIGAPARIDGQYKHDQPAIVDIEQDSPVPHPKPVTLARDQLANVRVRRPRIPRQRVDFAADLGGNVARHGLQSPARLPGKVNFMDVRHISLSLSNPQIKLATERIADFTAEE